MCGTVGEMPQNNIKCFFGTCTPPGSSPARSRLGGHRDLFSIDQFCRLMGRNAATMTRSSASLRTQNSSLPKIAFFVRDVSPVQQCETTRYAPRGRVVRRGAADVSGTLCTNTEPVSGFKGCMLKHKAHLSLGQDWGAAHAREFDSRSVGPTICCKLCTWITRTVKVPHNPTVSRANNEENGFTIHLPIHHTHDNHSAQRDDSSLFIN